MRRPRVLLADDHPMMLEGLRKLLQSDFEVVGMVADGHALLEEAKRLLPDLVIADISMPGLDGIEATRRLQAVLPGLRILILSTNTEPSWVRAAFEAGACGYLTKTSAPDEIETAVREVLMGRFYVSPVVTRAVLGATMQSPGATIQGAGTPMPSPGVASERRRPETQESLTRREHDIVQLVGLGLANKEIAQRLGVSVTTVRTHLSKVYDKLGTASRLELALLAVQTSGTVM
jgi:DNA-binding NarL/FixJ family response regulator